MVKYWLIAVLTLGTFRCVAQVSQEVSQELANPVDAIRAVFSNYVRFGESTDSDDHKHTMTKSLERLKGKKLTADDLQLLINVWMYYDPTDFPDAGRQSKALLKANKPESIAAVKYRIANKRDWEAKDSAPYSDLPALLKEIEAD